MGINTGDQNQSKTNMDENLPDNVSGRNIADAADVQGINNKPSTSTSVDVSGINDTNTANTNIKNLIAVGSTSSLVKQLPGSVSTSYHKRKPKPTGKHHRPAPHLIPLVPMMNQRNKL